MPAKLYSNSFRLDKAHSEGLESADTDTNPHPVTSPAGIAWQAGYDTAHPAPPPAPEGGGE